VRRETDQDRKQHVVRLKNEEGVIDYQD